MNLETKQVPFDELGVNKSESQELKASGTRDGFGMKKGSAGISAGSSKQIVF